MASARTFYTFVFGKKSPLLGKFWMFFISGIRQKMNGNGCIRNGNLVFGVFVLTNELG